MFSRKPIIWFSCFSHSLVFTGLLSSASQLFIYQSKNVKEKFQLWNYVQQFSYQMVIPFERTSTLLIAAMHSYTHNVLIIYVWLCAYACECVCVPALITKSFCVQIIEQVIMQHWNVNGICMREKDWENES